MLVERHVEGNDYRLQVFQGDVFWAVHRKPGGVTGDGVSSVARLLAALNADQRRGLKGSGLVLKRIEMNVEAERLLAEQGLAPHDVPEAGRFVRLRLAANVGNGGTPIPVLGQAHPDNLALGARAARVLRLDLAGIDVLMPDITRSWLETGAAIIEVNAQPQVSPHLHEWLVERLVQGTGRIPVVGVVGGDGRGFDALAAAALAAAQARGEGAGLGVAAAGGAWLGGRRINRESHLATAVQALLADPACTALLVHVDAERPGRTLPVDRFDALLLAEAPEQTAGTQERMAHIEALASASVEVWADAAHPQWHAVSATWPAPVRHRLDAESGRQRLLARLAGQPVPALVA